MKRKTGLVIALFTLLLIFPTSRLSSVRRQTDRERPTYGQDLIVHEWGTFTSVSGRDGVALEWRPLEEQSDLPGFVYTAESLTDGRGLRNPKRCLKCSIDALVRMETPVLYFYSDREATFSVSVDFPQGKITEWYPRARAVRDTAIDWGRVTVEPGAEIDFPTEPNHSHYYPARDTDSAPLRVCGDQSVEQEKFLFYRGVGFFSVPLRARLEQGSIVVNSIGYPSVDTVLLYENQNGLAGYRLEDNPEGTVVIPRPALTGEVESVGEDLTRELRSLLVSKGLFEREADAMLATWRDSWFEDGLRVFYVVPREVTDHVLPLTIEPKPSRIERVLVGRLEIITPEMESEVIDATQKESSEGAATALKSKYGRLLEPILKRAVQTASDPRVKSRLRHLLVQ